MSNNSQIMTYTPEIKEVFPTEVLDVIRTSLCPNATDPEFLLFAHKAASYRLDPFKNEIFFIKYGSQARIQFAAEAYLSKAREKEGFQPPDTQVVCENDTFKAKKTKVINESTGQQEDEWEIVEHEVSFPRGKIIGAYSIAYRDGYRPVTVFVDKDHIAHMYTGQNKDNWNKWEPDMIGKHAEQRGLKKQYGLDFGDENVDQQPVAVTDSFERKDITEEVIQSTPKAPEPKQPDNEDQNEADKIKALKAEMKRKFGKLGITDKPAMDEHMAKHFKVKGESPTIAEITAYLKILDLQIQEKQAAENAQDELPL
ncbi:RecT family recombinase [Paenibacillus sp. SAF-054]|uniref:RecT family recombinase n=1 Tax=unclassified Paenibacillus TaxID=185978 RepID=UPI003F7FED56